MADFPGETETAALPGNSLAIIELDSELDDSLDDSLIDWLDELLADEELVDDELSDDCELVDVDDELSDDAEVDDVELTELVLVEVLDREDKLLCDDADTVDDELLVLVDDGDVLELLL